MSYTGNLMDDFMRQFGSQMSPEMTRRWQERRLAYKGICPEARKLETKAELADWFENFSIACRSTGNHKKK